MRKQTALFAIVVLVAFFGLAATASITLEMLDARIASLEALHGVDASTSTTTTIARSTTTTTAASSTTSTTTSMPSGSARHVVIDKDTVVTDRLVLRPGDTVEFRNGAGLLFHDGGTADWQGSPTETWSDDGLTQNLDRDIRISGRGHIRFEHGSGQSTIRFVQIDLQPDLELAEYPLHWHHAGDGARGTLVEGVVVRNSTNRGFVPHASHGITFRDTIASNVTKSGYWWDPPPKFGSGDIHDESNNSNDITYDHVLVDGVIPPPGDPDKGRGLHGIFLTAGEGNTIRDSVGMNVVGSTKNGGCITWPAVNNKQPSVWTASNLAAHDCTVGFWTWQNNTQHHLIDGLRTWDNELDLSHGAYANDYLYRNVDLEMVEVHATGFTIEGGRASHVVAKRNPTGGTVTFRNVQVETFDIQNANANGDTPVHYVFDDTGLSFANVTPSDAVAGSTVTIDGKTRTY